MPIPPQKLSGEAAILRNEHLEKLIRHTLMTYLEQSNEMSVSEAADQVNENWDESTTLCVAALTVPLDIALHTHYDSPSHEKLAKFMRALSNKRTEVLNLQNHPENRRPYPLGNFGIYIYDTFTSSEPDSLLENVDDNDISDPEDPMLYVNLCAFLAQNLWPSGGFCDTKARYALISMIKINPTASMEERDSWAMGAAVFIVHQVEWIWQEVVKEIERRESIDREERARSETLPGCLKLSKRQRKPIAREKHHDFTWEAWTEWRTAFEKIAVDEAHGQTCRELARKAADLMTGQEKTMNVSEKS